LYCDFVAFYYPFLYLLTHGLLQLETINNKKKTDEFYMTKDRSRQPGSGRPPKWSDLEAFLVQQVTEAWEKGIPLCTEELMFRFQWHVKNLEIPAMTERFVEGKKNTVQKFLHRSLKKHKFSIHKNSISQSVPVDWQQKAEENTSRIRTLFRKENVDVVINADETFALFHMLDDHLIVPTGIKRVGTAAQVYGAKLMHQ
jgi:hypothetical protein